MAALNPRRNIMAEATHAMPKGARTAFDLSKLPNLEVPEAFREFAEKGATQTKQMYEQMRVGADEATNLLETTFKVASTGAVEFNRKVIENARTNADAFFDHAIALLGSKSLSEAIEVSTAHARKQFEAVTEQTKELTSLAQKLTPQTAEPIKEGINKAFKRVS
jgi:phasin